MKPKKIIVLVETPCIACGDILRLEEQAIWKPRTGCWHRTCDPTPEQRTQGRERMKVCYP